MVTIKVASEMTGLTVKSIRFYEDQGLVKPSCRSAGGYRLYSEEDILQLQQIRLYRDLKFSLKEIGLLLNSQETNKQKLMLAQLERVKLKRREYERVVRILETSIASGKNNREEQQGDGRPAAKIAIIGLDLQNDFLEGGALPCKRILTLISPLSRLFNEARRRSLPVIYVCDCHHQGIDEELKIWEDHCLEGTWGADIIKELAPHPQDYVVKKGYFNGFIQTELQEVLDQLGADTLIFVGWRTHVCITQTAIEAFHRGYRVIIALDGVNSTTREEHEFGLRTLEVNYGFEMYPCKEVLEAAAVPA
ncbi:MAG: isochorismatase family protein [Clostridiales bacterium]